LKHATRLVYETKAGRLTAVDRTFRVRL